MNLPNGPKSLIRELRKKQKLTQSGLSKHWMVSINTVQNWENSPSKVHAIKEFILLCYVLDCKPEELISDITEEETTTEISGFHENVRNISRSEAVSNNSLRVCELRENRHFTQQQVADALQVSVYTIANWENNRTSPNKFVKLIALCKIFECEPQDLLDYIPPADIERINNIFNAQEISNMSKEIDIGDIRQKLIKKSYNINIENKISSESHLEAKSNDGI